MDFITLNKEEQLAAIDQASENKPQVIFKHSTRCSVSTFAQRILKSEFSDEMNKNFDVHYLDLISYRPISNAIAERYKVDHESPQILVISEGSCIYHASHSDVSLEKALQVIN